MSIERAVSFSKHKPALVAGLLVPGSLVVQLVDLIGVEPTATGVNAVEVTITSTGP